MQKIAPTKRGRKSGQEIQEQVILALKNLQELGLLEESPLGRLPAVRQLAETEYKLSIFPTGFALRSSLLEAVNVVMKQFGEIPGYQREVRFIERFAEGASVTEISRELDLSREHVARTVQPKALRLVTKTFLNRTNNIVHSSR